jgi:uncharacterized membrane protein YkoI
VYRMVVFMIFLMATLIVPLVAEAQPGGRGFRGQDSYEGMPYGRYCPGPRWGRPYGARTTVKTADEAKQAIETYFAGSGQSVQVIKVEQKKWYFEADIANPDGKLIDKVIIDRRTGRIRSIY